MHRTARRVLWVAGAILLGAFTAVILSTWSGTCIDYVDAPGVCSFEPAVGGPQSVVLSIMALSGAAFCVVKAMRVRRSAR